MNYDDIFAGALRLLPEELRSCLVRMDERAKRSVEEIRLRTGTPMTVLLPEGERDMTTFCITNHHIDSVIDIATGSSVYAARESMNAGYITVRGGYRLGLCGSVIVRDGRAAGFKTVSSVNIRIPRDMTGLADMIASDLWRSGRLMSTLIVSPPGAGKTTLLRDIVRTASYGDLAHGIIPQRVSVADERGEIAAMSGGVPAMNVGPHTDVLDSCPRAEGVLMLLRAMSPEIIAFDEITAPADALAAASASKCGVTLLATAHGCTVSDTAEKELYRPLLESGVFDRVVFIEKRGEERRYRVYGRKEIIHAD